MLLWPAGLLMMLILSYGKFIAESCLSTSDSMAPIETQLVRKVNKGTTWPGGSPSGILKLYTEYRRLIQILATPCTTSGYVFSW